MLKNLLFRFIFCVLLLNLSLSFSQELPPIIKYSALTYEGGNQNWMITQDKNQHLYFANNEGLLEFNGSSWKLYPSPNETIIRSVKVIGDRIYTGCYMEFGFWKRQDDGRLKYTSLSTTIKNKILNDEIFWNIISYDQWVVFQSLNRIFIFDSQKGNFTIVATKKGITKSYKTNNSIYFQSLNDGLYEIESGKSRLVSNALILQKNRIVNVFSIDEGLLIQTEFNGFYKLANSILSKYSTAVDAELASTSIYSSIRLSDGSFVIGTVSKGIYILTKEGNLKYHITQILGLTNNTVLSLFEDYDKNLWVGSDNGINCLNLQSPIHSSTDDTGNLGTVYAAKLYQGKLYIGTNQGLFYKNNKSNEEFKLITGTKGQVWSLFEYDNTLFCGHDSGTFIIEDTTAKNIFSLSGTWKFQTVPNQKSLLLQGNYFGLSILTKVNNQWVFRNKIKGFDYSSRYFELDNTFGVYVSHEKQGIFRLQLDTKLQKTNSIITYSSPKSGKNSGLVKYNNTIYYAYKEGVFKLDSKTKQFKKDKLLSSVFENDEYTSGKMIVDNSNKIWLFSKNRIHYFSMSKLSNQLKQNAIPIPASLTNAMPGYENVTQISNYDYLIGTTDGYYILNISDLASKRYSVSISEITTNTLSEESIYRSINEEGEFKYDENNVSFNYTVPEYNKYIKAEYQYVLEGFHDEWSEWSTKPTVSFKNISSGDYVFKVRAKFANSSIENTAVYSFTILKPFYRTNFAIFIFLLFFLFLTRYIHKTYRNYYHKQQEKLIEENNRLLEIKELEIEQQLMKVENEKLTLDVDMKNRELAATSMSLNSKNELLAFIKEDLKKTSESNNSLSVKSVIRTINKNITEEDSWKVFKEAFDNADKDFLKKIKLAHPSLTPNDLRLCAYLRLNLSSKEIAPLLNISLRSVEIKRYRLRKKMDLHHDQGLVEYILSV
ncbi:helix-turn-helix and ligand-binding sensor domain-containing protein [Flavobacterium franklandianum]|uniref:LuxR family transcriptional regulator n=1 Tax=Flavobacterium franklandianum TaxID=2594430 RepID=A0A553CME3_9FLAO|nr:triple tyrosine motif-containing protein [Flavobacterium franklandianum]TRX21604.1 LuxR family transcriptional regulator [Flavobacterium franklandianum]